MNATRWMATLSLATLLLAGCGSDPGTRTNGEWLVLSPSGEPVTTTVDLDQLQYNSIEGQLAAGSGGMMVESVPDWGKNVTFGIAVPSEAMDPAWGDVSFVIEVPTKEMYLLYPDLYNVLVIRLSPDGMHFLAPLTVFATWMPWEGAPPEGLIFENDGDSGVPIVTQDGKRWRLRFEVDHFSDWRVGPRPIPGRSNSDEVPPITW
ncbi:MAG: hypothetical protein KDA27_13905 [Candidatus Eisenbacteria bacterium]|uniref:Uncharacterized protein n=1 Tax=Eiseniibacteriota bacterium TaxID=2212470 RepID=A0A956NCY1_UNCEI|nr:hypothetical protein [Candidatus Eisenbacteria bacterium]